MKTTILALLLLSSQTFADGGAVIAGGLQSPNALVITYTSIGRGADFATRTKVQSILISAMTKNELVAYTSKSWGLEGESTVCAQFENMSTREQWEVEIAKVVNASAQKTTNLTVTNNCDN